MPLSYIQTLRDTIQNLSKWESSGEAFGFIDLVTDDNPDYIYEFFCAIKILEDLSKNHFIKLIPGTKGAVFPQKPQPKEGWAKFIIINKVTSETILEFCLGIQIKLNASPDTTFSADISLQKTDSADPDETHAILLIDAKYKKSKNTKLDIGTIREFAMSIHDMNVPKSEIEQLIFYKLDVFKNNCLITNGEAIEKHKQYCKNHKLKQVVKFDCDGRILEVVG
jgi:hypothetical protein